MSSHNPGLRNTCKTILLYSHEGKKSRYEDSATVRREKNEKEEEILMMRPVFEYDTCTMGYR